MKLRNGNLSLWYGTREVPTVPKVVPENEILSIKLGVKPASKKNKVLVLFRVNKKKTSKIKARRVGGPKNAAEEFFQAKFPKFSAGDFVEYSAVLQSGTGQVPKILDKNKFQSSFTVKSAKPEPKSPKALKKEMVAIRREIQKTEDLILALRAKGEKSELGEKVPKKIPRNSRRGRASAAELSKKNLVLDLNVARKKLADLLLSLENLRQLFKPFQMAQLHQTLYDRHPIVLLPIRLETRFQQNQLWIRCFPDQLSIQNHRKLISESEFNSGKIYITEFLDADQDQNLTSDEKIEKKKAAWRALTAKYGIARAAWIASKFDANGNDDGQARTGDGWQEPPAVKVLPDFFIARLYRDDQLIHEKRGSLIPETLPMLWDPAEEAAGLDDIFDEKSRWITDFGAALKKGMGLKITNLTAEDLTEGFSKLVVIGVKGSITEAEGADKLNGLFESQYYSENLTFMDHFTPTNNTGKTRVSHSESKEDLEGTYELYCPHSAPSPAQAEDSNAAILGRALGLEISDSGNWIIPRHLKNVFNASKGTSEAIHDVQECLWPATMGYFLTLVSPNPKLWPGNFNKWLLLWDHFSRFVRPRGPLPSLLVDNIPYGFLPVSRLKNTGSGGWEPSPLDSYYGNPSEQPDYVEVDKISHEILSQLHDVWAELAKKPGAIPKIGDSTDPDEELLKILGMSPNLNSLKLRLFLGQDAPSFQLLIQLYWSFLGLQALPIFPGFGPGDWLEAWKRRKLGIKMASINLWAKALQTMIPGFSPRIADSQGKPLFPAPIFGLQKWNGEKVFRGPIAVMPGTSRTNTPAYLSQDISNPALMGKTLFSELTHRSWNIVKHPGYQKRIEEAVQNLNGNQVTGDVIEGFTLDSIDNCTHRLDAWFTSLASKRLLAMRKENPTGLYLGAYGCLEDLKPGLKTQADEEGGFLLCPDIDQATTGAVIRSAYLNYKKAGGDNPAKLNMTSERVRGTLKLLQGLAEGQSIGVQIGYMFERALHDRGLDRYKNVFRQAFPFTLDVQPDPSSGNGTSGPPPEAALPRNVINGLSLVDKVGDLKEAGIGVTLAAVLGSHYASINFTGNEGFILEEVNRIEPLLDSIFDVMVYESVFQSIQGKFERASAATDIMAGASNNFEVEGLQTPVSGVQLRHRLFMLSKEKTAPATQKNPRAKAEPTLNQRVFEVLGGDLAEIACEVRYKISTGTETNQKKIDVSLADLGIWPLDFMYISASVANGMTSNLERRVIEAVYAQDQNVADEPEFLIDFKASGNKPKTMADALEVASLFLKTLNEGRFVTPKSLVRPEDEDETVDFNVSDYDQLGGRVTTARDELNNALSLSDEILLKTAGLFGISGVFVEPGEDAATLQDRVTRVKEEITKRLSSCGVNLTEAATAKTADEFRGAIDHLVKAMKSLFGEAFIVIPTFKAPQGNNLQSAFNQSGLLGGLDKERINLWFQQLGQTHERIKPLETLFMVSGAWNEQTGAAANNELRIAQLPYCPERRWMALSDDEWVHPGNQTGTGECENPEVGRPRGVMSIAAWITGNIDFSSERLGGIIFDQFEETLPVPDIDAGLCFPYDHPNAKAPQTILVCVPGKYQEEAAEWSINEVFEIVLDTFKLAEFRLVDLDVLSSSPEASSFFPATFIPSKRQYPDITGGPPKPPDDTSGTTTTTNPRTTTNTSTAGNPRVGRTTVTNTATADLRTLDGS